MSASSEVLTTVLTYNRPGYLRRTLDSFLRVNGEALPGPVLVLAQGSGDDLRETLDVLDDFSERFPDRFIRMLSGGNDGVGYGWSYLMMQAFARRPEFILHLEDDWVSEEPLERYLPAVLDVLRSGAAGFIRLRSVLEAVAKPVERDHTIGPVTIGPGRFTFNPTIAPTHVLRQLVPAKHEKHARKRFRGLRLPAGQLRADCFRHIGEERAEGWKR